MIAQPYKRTALKRLELILALVVLLLGGGLIGSFVRKNNTAAARQTCLSNLAGIGQALGGYLEDNDQRWPYVAKLASVETRDPPWPTLPVVLAPRLGDGSGIFRCPADYRTLSSDNPLRQTFPASTTWFETEGTSYEYWMGRAYGGKRVGEESLSKPGGFGLGRADQPLLTDFDEFHKGDGGGTFNTLNADLKPRTTRSRGGE